MPEIEVNIELYCAQCGAGICGLGVATITRGVPSFRIDPCEKCIGKADEKGYDRGWDEGYSRAKEEGRTNRA